MAEASILDDILRELKRSKKKHPYWPDHIVAGAAIVCEESGELIRAALNHKYESKDKFDKEAWVKQMREEAIQTAAMAIRFLENLK
jgi:hypothetical protein